MTRSAEKLSLSLIFVVFAASILTAQQDDFPNLLQKAKLIHTFSISENNWRYPFFTVESKLLGVKSSKDRHFSLWNVRTGDLILNAYPCDGTGYGGPNLLRPWDRVLALGCNKGKAELWDIDKAKRIKTLQMSPTVKSYAKIYLASNAKNAVLQDQYGSVTELQDVETGRILANLDGYLMKGTPTSDGIAFSPDGKTVAISYSSADISLGTTIYLWDSQTGELIRRFIDPSLKIGSNRSHNSIVNRLAFTPDGKRLVSASYDTSAKIWDVETGKLIYTLLGHKHRLNALTVSPDGRLVATGSYDETAKVWDIKTGMLLWTTPKQKGEVWRVSFSPNGKRILTGTDNDFYLWNLEDRSLIGRLSGSFFKTAFSPDLEYVATAGKTKSTIDLYRLNLGAK